MMSEDFDDLDAADCVRVSDDGGTVWVYGADGSTIGRFSKKFGLDVHTTGTAQMNGAPQCLACTHEPARVEDWLRFVQLMKEHYDIEVDRDMVRFDAKPPSTARHTSARRPPPGAR